MPVAAQAQAQAQPDDANDAEADGEEIRERSVKVTFPKHGAPVPAAHIRDVVGRFGAVVDIGLKDKLAVVLFARSIEALNFSCNHNNALGEDFKVKFMGTKTVPPPGTIFPAPGKSVQDVVPAPAVAAAPATAPDSSSGSNALTKAEKAAAAAAAAASLAAAAMNEGASDSQAGDGGQGPAQAADQAPPGIGERHRDSKVVILDTLKREVESTLAAPAPAPAPAPATATATAPAPTIPIPDAPDGASPTASQAPSPTSSGWKQATRVSALTPPAPPPALPTSASRGSLATLDDGTKASDEDSDSDNGSISIDMDDLRRDIQSLAPAPPTAAPIPATVNVTAAATVRSPSPAEVSVQRLAVKVISSAKASSRDGPTGALGDSGRSDGSSGSLLQAVWSQGEVTDSDVAPRTLTHSPPRRGAADTTARVNDTAGDPNAQSPPPTATKRPSSVRKTAKTPDKWGRLSGAHAAPGTGQDTAATAALLAVSASMEEELRMLRKKVVLLEAEAKVRTHVGPPGNASSVWRVPHIQAHQPLTPHGQGAQPRAR